MTTSPTILAAAALREEAALHRESCQLNGNDWQCRDCPGTADECTSRNRHDELLRLANQIEESHLELRKAQAQAADFRRQLTAEREGRMAAERIVDEVRARNRELEMNAPTRRGDATGQSRTDLSGAVGAPSCGAGNDE